ncbi:uncharacterized protein MELLADRAFT_108228 [Melampsora larici-populina 98AG31]|uniref:Uncharacterized protein n=1 Tax=Melampsora larici-populina (strain 98AG31 / pathotype 3-4-7) TaxID=747676 RepID=F4RSD8_MELLP|nr:uncharacterized protein MELLADRAFT_108228 [Melampsora larici-populina 98AG31]EGG04708.1 hypothetical protein MELLADRAFT_108228 [Melampsora larici-populina 98AG31]
MKFFSYIFPFAPSVSPQSSPRLEEQRPLADTSDSPPPYVSLYPNKIAINSESQSHYHLDQKSQQARPFPKDWQTSVGPTNSVLRGTARPDENVGRRDETTA